MHVCDNVGDHLQGNVYIRFEWEAEAQKAVDELNDRWYNGECRGGVAFVVNRLGGDDLAALGVSLRRIFLRV